MTGEIGQGKLVEGISEGADVDEKNKGLYEKRY